MTQFLLVIIYIYQKLISPLLPALCRYYPTCSQYGHIALRWHGAWRGALLISARIARCHPWGGSGIDFVPLPLYRYYYHYLPQPKYQQLTFAQGVYVDRFSYVYHLNQQLKLL
ncbi:membrane protein insertion efficiency factor YidD [Psychrobacter sp. I-STPA10]|uniref:membrane protein insertion efficiency factor YidD n=1 Tax=Psychrobacter sp. I-STPA10 TaxID=2585769 RepID=UPI001E41546B|nr:membrane protein insertion efficiency factor YidD [Psychrobacter sp. I-STPA10]